MKIYLAHPISGCTGPEVFGYYDTLVDVLSDVGYEVLCPMKGKAYLRFERRYKAKDYRHPISTNHSIYHRDQWMVRNCDIIYANLIGAERVSIGTMMELAWASILGKYVVVAMEEDNPHQHAFVLEAGQTIFESHEEALQYLTNFVDTRL